MSTTISFTSSLWRYPGEKGSWYFITVPPKETELIRWIGDKHTAAFGSVRVEATIGSSIWQTSIFPDTKKNTYVLPIKRTIRKSEQLKEGTTIDIKLSILSSLT